MVKKTTKYKNPHFTIDNVLFTVKDNALRVLMVKRAIEPFINRWSLPGGFVDIDLDDTTEMTALRKLKEKTNITPQYLEQLQTFSGINRDPRGFSITLVYFALIAEQKTTHHIESVEDVQWINLNDLNTFPVAFDHKLIIQHAKERLQQKTLYSMIPVYCLPSKFTIGQLKSVIEVIIEKTIQRKSLIRRVNASNMFEELNEKAISGGRLAQLYKIKTGVEIVNFERNFNV